MKSKLIGTTTIVIINEDNVVGVFNEHVCISAQQVGHVRLRRIVSKRTAPLTHKALIDAAKKAVEDQPSFRELIRGQITPMS